MNPETLTTGDFPGSPVQRASQRIVAVTGAAGGLGRQVVQRFAAEGARVACADVDAEALSRTVASHGNAVGADVAVVDCSDEQQVSAWRDSITERWGHADIVVNCSGVLNRDSMAATDLTAFLAVVGVNLGGSYALARAFVPGMVLGGWGRIVNVASIAGLTGYPFAAYAASKAAMVNLTKSLLFEVWGTGVTVNAVCPGAMETPMLDQDSAAWMRPKIPTGATAHPRDVAALISFLCSDSAAGISGTAIPVDGGATAYFSYADR